MPAMVDPHMSYLSFREEVERGTLPLVSCTLHPNIKLHVDEPEGQKRFTYTTLKNNTTKGILQITSSGRDGDVFYFQLGIAVGEEFRGKGVGRELHQKGLEEFLAHFPIPKGKKIGIEAVISQSNIASQKLAAKVFTNPPTQIKDKFSGEEALRYEFIVVG